MKIGIALNEVLRDFIGQFTYTYSRLIGPTNIKENDVTSLNLIDFFKFDNINELNTFLYLEHPLEIFGHADQLENDLINQFNRFITDMEDEGEHEIILVTREVNKSIPATNFFLSKTACQAKTIRFHKSYPDKWNDIDVLITANPTTLLNKPNGKISVKVKASYNKDSVADYEIESILDFIKDKELRDKILNSKTISYEELNK